MKFFSTTILILFSLSTYAQDADKAVTITVSGSGKTQEEAKQSALRSAIEQAFGAFISSKTEILNDQVVADQMSSVASGNIQSFEVLNEAQLPDGTWANTIKAVVSVSKLISFVGAKGIAIEIKGGLFALNIKQQILNEQGEVNAISNMVGILHEIMQTSFDYTIKSSEPKSVDTENKNWELPLSVTATANKNLEFCADYFSKTLSALRLDSADIESYKTLNKKMYPITVEYNGHTQTFFVRKKISVNAISAFAYQWDFYTMNFNVDCGINRTQIKINNHKSDLYDLSKAVLYPGWQEKVAISFLTSGKLAGTFTWNDELTLAQIEQISSYSVKSKGVSSAFKYGGIVVYEKDGHGLVLAVADLQEMVWDKANQACNDLILSGYDDWRLPTKDEIDLINTHLTEIKIGAMVNKYWTSTESENRDGRSEGKFLYHAPYKIFQIAPSNSDNPNYQTVHSRAVRSF